MKLQKYLCFLVILTLTSSKLFAQDMPILLSNHTYSMANPEVGILASVGGGNSFKLKGKNARKFVLSGNKLSILPKYINEKNRWYDIDIETTNGLLKVSESFRIVHDQFIRNKVIAHRGAWKNTGAAENSIAALEQAIRLGCQGSEFDVHMSADSVLVINHDATIQGITIATSNADKLANLKLSSGENMPTLEAYLKAGMAQNRTKLILEIKPTTSKERALQLTQKVFALVKKMKAQAWIDYISFDYNICMELNRLDPNSRVAYLNGDKSPAVLANDKIWGFDYHFSVFEKNQSWIDEAKEKGLTINAWTVNDEKTLKWFLDKNIDFITTNEPELLLKLVGN